MGIKDIEITNFDKIDHLLRAARVCSVALNDGKFPYIVPMCFGYNLEGENWSYTSAPKKKARKWTCLKRTTMRHLKSTS